MLRITVLDCIMRLLDVIGNPLYLGVKLQPWFSFLTRYVLVVFVCDEKGTCVFLMRPSLVKLHG